LKGRLACSPPSAIAGRRGKGNGGQRQRSLDELGMTRYGLGGRPDVGTPIRNREQLKRQAPNDVAARPCLIVRQESLRFFAGSVMSSSPA